MTGGNLFAGLPGEKFGEEQVSEILARPRLKIERIVSTGQASPPGFWYDQPWDEWVALLSGAARLRFENETEARGLAPGDHVHIPAHARHRVDWTSANPPAVWLAVHFAPDENS
jgi:cupin 2 domain-containing protein